MAKKELVLTEKEQNFISALMENGGNLQDAAEAAGYNRRYVYELRKRLSREIAEAALHYMSLKSIRAAHHVVEVMEGTGEEEIPNLIRFQAAKDILDRCGVKYIEPTEAPQQVVVRPNIFILPEKKETSITIDNDLEHKLPKPE